MTAPLSSSKNKVASLQEGQFPYNKSSDIISDETRSILSGHVILSRPRSFAFKNTSQLSEIDVVELTKIIEKWKQNSAYLATKYPT